MITIIIPTKNRPKFLIDLVASIDRQKKGPLELIIVDQSNEYNADISLKKNYIKYFYRKDIFNLCDAKNFGLKFSSGEYIGFLDDDIILEENFLEELNSCLKNNPLGVSGVEDRTFISNYLIYIFKVIAYRGIFKDGRLIYKNYSSHYKKTNKIFGGCTFFRSEIFNKVKFRINSPLFINEDTDFSLIVKSEFNEDFIINTKLKYIHFTTTPNVSDKNVKDDIIEKKILSNLISYRYLHFFHKNSFYNTLSLFWIFFCHFHYLLFLSIYKININFIILFFKSIFCPIRKIK